MAYCILRMKSLSLSLLTNTTAGMNGRRITLIGKKVIETPPMTLSKLELFFNLMMFILRKASRFLNTTLYLLMNMATKKLSSKMLKM